MSAGSENLVILIGRAGKDPDMRFTPGGRAVTTLSLATNENWTDQNGDRQQRTEWHRLVFWSTNAENCAKLVTKGRQLYIIGRLQTRSWEDRNGNKRYVTEIHVTKWQLLDSMNRSEEEGRKTDIREDSHDGSQDASVGDPDYLQDIPF